MSTTTYAAVLLLMVSLIGAPRIASADPVVIFSTLGPAPGYVPPPWTSEDRAWVTFGLDGFLMGFVPDQRHRLTSIGTAFTRPAGESGDAFLYLYGPERGGRPGPSPEIWLLPHGAPADGQTATWVSVPSVNNPILEAGTMYFLGIHSAVANPEWLHVIWPWNNAGVQGTVWQVREGRRFTGTLSAFELIGEPAPVAEPATLLLFASGSAVLVRRARRRSQPR
jgi:hypothetical protein